MKHSVILVKYWSNSSKRNSKVSKRKLTSLNPPFLGCLNLYIDAYSAKGALWEDAHKTDNTWHCAERRDWYFYFDSYTT